MTDVEEALKSLVEEGSTIYVVPCSTFAHQSMGSSPSVEGLRSFRTRPFVFSSRYVHVDEIQA